MIYNTSKLQVDYFGFFDSPEQTTPVYDPGDSAPCLLCFEPWTEDTVRTISFTALQPDKRTGSYFYRVHRSCHDQWMADHGSEMEPPGAWLVDVLEGSA